MIRKKKNPNNHKRDTPSTIGGSKEDEKFTTYDTKKSQTSTPQRVRESSEASAQHERNKKAKGE